MDRVFGITMIFKTDIVPRGILLLGRRELELGTSFNVPQEHYNPCFQRVDRLLEDGVEVAENEEEEAAAAGMVLPKSLRCRARYE